MRNVTDRRERERRLRERTEAFKILGRVLGHEIRNDMSVALGWLGEIRRGCPPETAARLDCVLEACDHVLETTEAVRTLASVEYGTGGLLKGPTDLAAVLRSEVDRARRTYPSAAVSLDLRVGTDGRAVADGAGSSATDPEPSVRTMAGPFVAVAVRHLLNNAIHHNDTRSPTVDVSLAVDRGDNTVEVQVADDGPGLSDEHKPRAFEWSPEAPDNPTTGIGLHLVASVVESYDGRVRLTDRDPRGAVAHPTVPLVG